MGALNNQCAEFHMKYKYLTNLEKSLLRKESIITVNAQNVYCKIIAIIPDNYVVISSKDIFQKHPNNNNTYWYNGILNGEKLEEYFQLSPKKASWVIYKELTLYANYNIEQCTLIMNRIYKGGNLKELIFEAKNENGKFINDENEDKFIFNFKGLNTNRTIIRFNIKVENSTSYYKFIEKKELITTVPEEDKYFF